MTGRDWKRSELGRKGKVADGREVCSFRSTSGGPPGYKIWMKAFWQGELAVLSVLNHELLIGSRVRYKTYRCALPSRERRQLVEGDLPVRMRRRAHTSTDKKEQTKHERLEKVPQMH